MAKVESVANSESAGGDKNGGGGALKQDEKLEAMSNPPEVVNRTGRDNPKKRKGKTRGKAPQGETGCGDGNGLEVKKQKPEILRPFGPAENQGQPKTASRSPQVEGKISKNRIKLGRGERVLNVRDLEGYRGEEDIDTILEFLESKEGTNKENLPEEKPKKRKKPHRRRKKSKKQLESVSVAASIPAEPPTPTPTVALKERTISDESELHAFANRAGFQLNVQYDDGGGVKTEKKPSRHETPLEFEQEGEDGVTLDIITESGVCKLILVGFTFPVEGSLTEVEIQEAIALMDQRAAELKRLAREGLITSLFV